MSDEVALQPQMVVTLSFSEFDLNLSRDVVATCVDGENHVVASLFDSCHFFMCSGVKGDIDTDVSIDVGGESIDVGGDAAEEM